MAGKPKYGWSDLRELYLKERLSPPQIAEIKGCSSNTVREALDRAGLARRTRSEATRLSLEQGRFNIMRGVKNPNWKGGKRKTGHGYILVRLYPANFFYPMTGKDGYVYEHRLVMAQHLNRCLDPWELVHHKDGIKTRNELENLKLSIRGKHSKEHSKGYSDGYRQGYLDAQTAVFNPLKLQNDALLQQIRQVKLQIKLLQWQIKEREESYNE